MGVSVETVTESEAAPTFISTLIVAVKFDCSSISRLTALKPGRLNSKVYVPGRKSTMRYAPRSSLTTERVFSISAGLLASIDTPGRTAPLSSLITPVNALCARLSDASAVKHTANTKTPQAGTLMDLLILPPKDQFGCLVRKDWFWSPYIRSGRRGQQRKRLSEALRQCLTLLWLCFCASRDRAHDVNGRACVTQSGKNKPTTYFCEYRADVAVS